MEEVLKLGDVVSISKGKKHTSVFDSEKVKAKRYIQIEDLRNDFNLKYTNETGVDVNSNDVVIAWDGANAGTIGFNLDGYIGSTLARLRINNGKIDPKYLGTLLKGKFDYLRSNCTGATIPHISRASLENIPVPILPIKTQQKIASILEQADAARQKRKLANELTEQFLKSVFLEMFGDPVRNEKGWNKIKFKEAVKNENAKRIPVKQGDRDNREGIYPYYGATGIIDTIDDYKFEGEYLLIAEDGKNLLFRKKNNAFMARGRFWVNNHAHVLSFNGNCNLRYLEFFLTSIDFRPFISGIDQVKLNKENLDKIPVPYPPISLQTQFAHIVEKAEALKAQYQSSLQELENLYGSLSQKAFKGELEFSKEVTRAE